MRLRSPSWSELGLAAFAVWIGAAFAAAAYRPGELLEVAALGFAGALYWRLATNATNWLRLVALPFLSAPLLNTWPAARYAHVVDSALPSGSFLLSNIPSVLLFVIAAAALRAGNLRRPPWLLVGAMFCLLIGAAAATAVAEDFSSSVQAFWLTFAVPIALAYIIAGRAQTSTEGWRCLFIAVGAALVPVTVGIAAYLLQFGVPGSGAELVRNKLALSRPFLVQATTFGNVGHLGDLVLLLLPAAVLGATPWMQSRVARTTAALASVGYVLALILVLERAEIFFAGLALAVIGFVVALREGYRALTAPVLALAALVVVSVSPGVIDYYQSLLPKGGETPAEVKRPSSAPTKAPVHPKPKPSPTRKASTAVVVPVLNARQTDASSVTRLEAVRKGLRIFRSHAPWGVGPGQYQRYDATFTAAHSLPVQLLAEDGVLGGVGFLLLVAYLVREAIRLLVNFRRFPPSGFRLRLALLAGTGLFLAQATATGSLFTVGALNVWAALFWLQLGILVATGGSPEREEISAA